MKHKSRLSILILALLTTIVLPGSAPIQRSSPDASQRTYAATFSILPPKDVISPLATLQSTSEEESNQIPHHPLGGQAGGQRISYRQLATLIANANRQYGTYSAERIASGVSWLSPFAQTNLPVELLADGQFVWGPNVGDFDIRSFLQARDSALQAYSDDIELWARYTSVNPKILLTVLELRYGLVNALPPDHDPDAVRANIENTSLNMAIAFYEHLHTWGSRRLPWDLKALATNPPLIFADGSIIQLTSEQASGSFAVAAAVANATEFDTWIQEMFDLGPDGFHGVLGGMFPEVDPLDASNDIDPSTPPPDNLFQFPFPLGATWRFGGPHSWAGDNTPPFSSMDFHEGGATCSAPPGLYTVAAAGGTAYRPWGYTCWLEIDHGNDWTTSYYHMQNTIDPQGVSLYQNSSLGTIACEVCAGGWASGPHVHWTLKYNGAYVSLEGVKVSGWTIHVGPTAYNSGYIERDGVTLNP
ncbi:MAG: peptidoglycan DD-metalloendopeptidase family protein, partial [Anaerolineales bacterium]|nr:peptidoglycan DD-metalloendopeptidase family protein [Anaerolineales bacterium]